MASIVMAFMGIVYRHVLGLGRLQLVGAWAVALEGEGRPRVPVQCDSAGLTRQHSGWPRLAGPDMGGAAGEGHDVPAGHAGAPRSEGRGPLRCDYM